MSWLSVYLDLVPPASFLIRTSLAHSRSRASNYLWLEEMYDAVAHPLESDGAEEEDDEDDVRVDGRHVDDLRVLRDPLHYAHVHEDPEKTVAVGDLTTNKLSMTEQ